MIKGHTEAKYYIIAILIYTISITIFSFMTNGWVENSDINHYAFLFGSYIEIVFFSFMLANRFHKMQNNTIKIQKELITIKQQNEKVLENRVKKRTKKITKLLGEKELLLKEVYHRVKNNFQIIIGLLWIELSKEISKEHKNSFLGLISRIESMSKIHQYLLNLKAFSKIKSEKYIVEIINETQKIYQKDKINIDTEIDSCILDIDYAMTLSVIINEVLNNSIKYRDQKNSCDIFLSFKVLDNKITLIIKDNGPGFIPNRQTEGFGLKMINQFAKKLKSSYIEFNSKSGTEFKLSFEL